MLKLLVFVLSAVFAAAFFYLAYEVPRALDAALRPYFPDLPIDSWGEAADAFRPLGVAAFVATLALIAVGLAARMSALALSGVLALYVPTFGYFALSMFLLAGVGVLRALWLPVIDWWPQSMRLGCVLFIPATWTSIFPPVAVAAGAFVFSLGVASWLYGRFTGRGLVDIGIYRYSRHPQYFGFLLWSYGQTASTYHLPYVKGAFAEPPTAVWLTTAAVVAAVALIEERKMLERYGEAYEIYRRRTPFMAPMPDFLRRAFAYPLKRLDTPHILAAVSLYASSAAAASYLLAQVGLC